MESHYTRMSFSPEWGIQKYIGEANIARTKQGGRLLEIDSLDTKIHALLGGCLKAEFRLEEKGFLGKLRAKIKYGKDAEEMKYNIVIKPQGSDAQGQVKFTISKAGYDRLMKEAREQEPKK